MDSWDIKRMTTSLCNFIYFFFFSNDDTRKKASHALIFRTISVVRNQSFKKQLPPKAVTLKINF